MTRPELTKDRIWAMFLRYGDKGDHTGAFDSFSENTQRSIGDRCPWSLDETPVLASVLNESEWVLVTTQRLYWTEKDTVQVLEFSSISAVRTLIRKRNKISNIEVLEIRTTEGRIHEIRVEGGYPLGGLWNLLAYLAARGESEVGG